MQTSISEAVLVRYVAAQCMHFFPDGDDLDIKALNAAVSTALERLEHCFRGVILSRYCVENQPRFNHLDSDQYLIFLWFVSNELWKSQQNDHVASKIFLLNKALHSFNCMFDCPLPNVFIVIHGVGTVLGKANYDDFLLVYQGCTVGAQAGDYPVLGRGVALGAGAKVIGSCKIGSYASVGAGTVLFGQNVEERHAILREPSGALIRRPSTPLAERVFSRQSLYG